MISDLFNGGRLLVAALIIGAALYFVTPIIPQIVAAFTIPERINAENAQNASDAIAAPTFTALRVQATRAAIENESLQAQAQANAQTIQAQSMADSARLTAQTWQGVAVGGLVLAGAALAFLFVYLGLRLYLGQRVHHDALRAAQQSGSTLLLPNGHAVEFKQLDAPPAQTVNPLPKESQRVER